MVENSRKNPKKREYPLFFEKAIPIAIGVLVLIIIGMLIFAIAVILGAI